jgi:hypothetical protein
MSPNVPDYYRHLVDPAPPNDPDDAPGKAASPPASPSGSLQTSEPTDEPRRYRADAFSLPLPGPDWRDGTDYTLLGPVSGGLRHNIVVQVDPDTDAQSLSDYVGAQMGELETALPEGRLLMHGPLLLDDGTGAYRSIFRWLPENRDDPLYQEQVYVYHDGCGYTLTASFSSETRKRFGAAIESLMRRFRPVPASAETGPAPSPPHSLRPAGARRDG